MENHSRKYSCELLELVDEGMIDPIFALEMCIEWMSEHEVKTMMVENEVTREQLNEWD